MNIPVLNRSRILMFAMIVMTFAISASVSFGQRTIKLEAESADIDQCRNGVTGTDPCSGSNWVNGNVGAQNSFYAEDQYLPYRMKFGDLATGAFVHTVIIGYDIKHSDKNAIDYLGSYNTLQITNRAAGTGTTRSVDPCSGIAGCAGWPQSAIPISLDTGFVTTQPNPNIGGTIYQPGVGGSAFQEFRMWGGTLLSFNYTAVDGVIGDAQVERQITITFTTTVPNPVLAWSGHVGWAGDWGDGQAAGGISGSPYHMRLIDLNGSGGNQDRSLSADAIDPTAAMFVRKEVLTQNCANSNPDMFGFTASANFGAPGNVFLRSDNNASPIIDDPNNPDPQFMIFDCSSFTPGSALASAQISSFVNNDNVVTITESAVFGWTLSDLDCVQSGGGTPTFTPNLDTRTLSVTLAPFRIVTCTFTNLLGTPSAAPAVVGGRVVGANGRGISGVTMTLTDLSTGEPRIASTNTFGYYMFENVETTLFYSLSVKSRRHTFETSTRFFTLEEDSFDMNFFASN